jgi:hypothetical protein
MRVPDRPWAETDAVGADSRRAGWDHRAAAGDLSDRLARLVAGHPSADHAGDPDGHDLDPGDLGPGHLNPDDLGPDDLGPDDLGPDDLGTEDLGPGEPGPEDMDPDGLTPDDLESADVGAGDAHDATAADGFRLHRTANAPPLDGLGGNPRTGYRPWFGADGVSDPWFGADGVSDPWFAPKQPE